MCGIVGYLNLDNSAVEPREPYLDEMIKSIHHRGPDETGRIIVGPAALGMTRLSIIDLKPGSSQYSTKTKVSVLSSTAKSITFKSCGTR